MGSVSQLIIKNEQKWSDVSVDDLIKMIESSDKKKHEIVGEKIRAFYGHSIPMKTYRDVQKPPQILYHRTAKKSVNLVYENGLLTKSRKYVHLSQDIKLLHELENEEMSNRSFCYR